QSKIDSSTTSLNRIDFTPLPNSGEEVARAVQIWGGQYLLGTDATEKTFRDLAGDYRVIHMATHGVANFTAGNYSYLAFTEVPDDAENELLYVSELYNLKLNADLVILSACETGTGELKHGEGVISLARAFASAGAKSMVTSLWIADDAATKNIMIDFHSNLKKGDSIDQALTKAKLNYMKSSRSTASSHPFFWAGFIPVGDMKALRN
ncbi:MAG: CHAT domain-containing protein, partial [Bacteroidota bacterium]